MDRTQFLLFLWFPSKNNTCENIWNRFRWVSACHHNFSWFIGLLAVGFGAETMLMVWHHPPFRSSFFFLLLATTWTVENRKIHGSNWSGCTVYETCLKMLQNFLCHYSSRSLVMNSLMYHFHTIRICKNNSNMMKCCFLITSLFFQILVHVDIQKNSTNYENTV